MTEHDYMAAATPSSSAGHSMPALALRGATVRYGGILAVDDVSMEVSAGETVGLIGPNGAGKTTLVDVVGGSRRPQAGAVLLYGKRVTSLSALRRARLGLARTFQQLSLFDGMTVWEHILLGYAAGAARAMPSARFLSRRSRLEQAARADRSELSPTALLERLGLASVANELATAQALGVARTVDLARALASRPRLLLLDEPVSGLSASDAEVVGELFQSIRREHEIAVLVIEHNLEFARLVSDRIVALDFGKVIADGRPDEVLGSTAVHRAYFGVAPEHATPDTGDRSVESLDSRG